MKLIDVLEWCAIALAISITIVVICGLFAVGFKAIKEELNKKP